MNARARARSCRTTPGRKESNESALAGGEGGRMQLETVWSSCRGIAIARADLWCARGYTSRRVRGDSNWTRIDGKRRCTCRTTYGRRAVLARRSRIYPPEITWENVKNITTTSCICIPATFMALSRTEPRCFTTRNDTVKTRPAQIRRAQCRAIVKL